MTLKLCALPVIVLAVSHLFSFNAQAASLSCQDPELQAALSQLEDLELRARSSQELASTQLATYENLHGNAKSLASVATALGITDAIVAGGLGGLELGGALVDVAAPASSGILNQLAAAVIFKLVGGVAGGVGLGGFTAYEAASGASRQSSFIDLVRELNVPERSALLADQLPNLRTRLVLLREQFAQAHRTLNEIVEPRLDQMERDASWLHLGWDEVEFLAAKAAVEQAHLRWYELAVTTYSQLSRLYASSCQ